MVNNPFDDEVGFAPWSGVPLLEVPLTYSECDLLETDVDEPGSQLVQMGSLCLMEVMEL